jgi:AAA family ATPase
MTQLAKAPGWTQIVRLLPSELGSSTSKINSAISKAFTEASAAQPSLLIIDDIDSIAGRQSESSAIATILADHARTIRGTRIQIIAAARRPIDVNQKLLPCFKKKIEIPTPSPLSRRKILAHFSVGLSENDVLQYVAEKTHAFNAEDLDELCIKAHEAAEQRQLRTSSGETNNITEVSAQDTTATTYVAPSSISKQDFQQALRHVHPSLMNELYIEVPKVHWSDIAGSTQVKRKLWEAVELPLKHPDIVSRLNLHLNHGILLYGPPGCSKTMTAKALATESGLNFIAVKGPELVSKYVGESEYKIREIFRKARAASPSVIFFDEIDSIVPNREGGGGHEGLNTVATLLNEMAGVEDLQGVLVLAATNRPDAIDPALLRPGRLGTSLYVGPPDYDAILEILKMRTSKMGGKGLDLPIIASRIADNGYFSGADVGAVCDAAGMLCATEAVGEGADQNLELEQRHLEQALLDVEPSLNKAQLGFLSGWGVGKGGE